MASNATQMLSPEVMRMAQARERSSAWQQTRVAWIFIAPAVIMVTIFLLTPVVFNVILSFTKWRKFTGLDQFAGFANYQRLFVVPYFSEALGNTALWVVGAIIFPLALGLGLALLLRNIPFQETFKSLYFLPKVLAPTAVGAIWYYVYAPHGVINSAVSGLTGSEFDFGWIFVPETVTLSIIFTFVWQTVGITMVLLLLGLAAIPRDPLEAARVDGASQWQIFRHIIWPLLMPTVLVVTILNVAAGFTTFDLLWVMASSYPGKRTLSLAVYMYYESFSNGAWAYGSAVAVVLGGMVITVSAALAVVQSRVEKSIR
ncbi:sugar ABC transporter permease [Devosia rhodophyticola]|uniref:Sugar ABC transporter permease n=1 Tax=Devosia rhodophyticola TaxID=3026423 RepID=A0ABY7YZP5_9HYPH|nr:sugar ABC transporter permease [Devosia rhodophyticola]WDR06863.1 sugar ABC transporter permease [Devosia rhodophyticola]